LIYDLLDYILTWYFNSKKQNKMETN